MSSYLAAFKCWLAVLAATVLLGGCGGGGGLASFISGTAATGAAMSGTVDLVDANGVSRAVTIGAGGAFTVDTTGLAAPFILRATGSGGNAGTTLYSMADAVTGVFNITPLTHLALELMRQNGGAGMPLDLAALYAAWNAQVNPADVATLQAAIMQYQAVINANLATQFQAQGLTPTTFDFLRTAFVANSQGIDAVLDAITNLTITGNQIGMLVGGSLFNFNGGISTAGFNIGGTASGTTGGGAGGLTCNTNLFQPNSVHVATTQELTNFAGSYTGQVYTNDGTGNYVPGNGTAGFSSSGALTLNGQAKTPTSICVDNAAGPNGNVLYVHFADGHVDLFSNMTFSGTIDTPAGGGGAGAANTAIGPHLAGFTFPITMANVVGTYDVAIYRVPVGQESLIGPAKLTISETAGVKAMELATPGGTVISHIDTNYPHLPPATSFQFYANISQITGVNGTAIDNYLVVKFGAAGLLTGTAGGFSQIGFRNNMTAYNTSLPAAFAALAGTWIGPAQALTCGQPNVTVTITAAGKVTVNGTPNLSCTTGTIVEATWDGNDDYIIPLSTGGYQIALDSLKGGGSTSGGGIYINIPDPTNPTSITKVQTNMAGAAGSIEANSPVKQ